jgi:peroxiredoxin Q/BCP
MASTDDLDTNTKFAKEHDADFPILSDAGKKVAEAYGVLSPSGRARRHTFYIGADGKILFIDRSAGQSQTVNAGATLVAKLEELAAKGVIKRKK